MLPILIIGAGPAGASTAIFLAQAGYEVVVVDRGRNQPFKIGESLPPNCTHVLRQLDVWDEFQAGQHLKCNGNQSIWGQEKVQYTDFMMQPPGYGWHIDRMAFEKMLRDKASSLGAIVRTPISVFSATFDGQNWELRWKDEQGTESKQYFSYIVDASGRNSWLARRIGVDRLYEDQQLALIAFLAIENTNFEQSHSLIETSEAGWWYSAQIPHNKFATAFICTPTPSQRKKWIKKEAWWNLIQETKQSHQRMIESEAVLSQAPYFVSAESGILEKVYGEGWIAVGDAALSYDPIASHGILMSMLSARQAAVAITHYLNGEAEGLEAYQQLLFDAYMQYSKQRKDLYKSERRFLDSSYWQQRMKD